MLARVGACIAALYLLTLPLEGDARRFVALDGLRGVAALCVLYTHATGLAFDGEGFNGGFLAVDFFFVLSGFVVARAYEHKLEDMLTFGGFAKIRFKRLYPAIVVGVILGTLALLGTGYSPSATAIYALAGLVFIPLFSVPALGIFPINGPMWSLFFELFANAVHGVWLWRFKVLLLVLIVMVSYACLLLLDSGFYIGFARVLFGYTAGIIVFRLWKNGKLPHVPALLCLALPLVCIANYWVPTYVLIASFPFIVAAGVRANLNGFWERVSELLGRLSYPLYATHFPVVMLVMLMPFDKGALMALGIVLALVVGGLVAYLLEPRSGVRDRERGRVPPAIVDQAAVKR